MTPPAARPYACSQADIFGAWEDKEWWVGVNCARCWWHDSCDAAAALTDPDSHFDTPVSSAVVALTGLGPLRHQDPARACREFLSGDFEAYRQAVLAGPGWPFAVAPDTDPEGPEEDHP
jgi:hypothetical protein